MASSRSHAPAFDARLTVSLAAAIAVHASAAAFAFGDVESRETKAPTAVLQGAVFVDLAPVEQPAAGKDVRDSEEAHRPEAKRTVTSSGRAPAKPRRAASDVPEPPTPSSNALNSLLAAAPLASDGPSESKSALGEATGRMGLGATRGTRGTGPNGAGSGAAPGSGRHAAAPRRPILLAPPDPCRGLFPYRADEDRGIVTVALRVTRSGTSEGPRVLEEWPRGQGFGSAAANCAQRLRFLPALDAKGIPSPSQSVVRLRFARR